jgi:N4-gp56 family major capsid protein
MADTIIGDTSDQAVKRWSDELMRETFGKMAIRGLIGRSNDSPIKLLTDLDKDPGDNIKFDLRKQDRSAGVSGDAPLSGAFFNAAADDQGGESELIFWQDELNVNQKRNAHVFGSMTQQRTVHDLRKEARDSMSNWFAWGIEAGTLGHLAGNVGDGAETAELFLYEAGGSTAGAGTDVFGNTVAAIDAAHRVDGSGGTFVTGLIEDAVAKAKTVNPRVAPARIDGEMGYIMLIHPYAARSLRKELDTTGNASWIDSMRRAAVRGEANPIWTGALGKYNGVILVENEFVPYTAIGDINWNVFMGACAGAIAFGNAWNRMSRVRSGGGGSYWSYIENVDDYGNKTGFGTGSVMGVTRAMFDSGPIDASAAFGAILVVSQDAPPA